jgi:hypothetical protein
MSVLPGAIILYLGEQRDWELWLKTGPEYPVYSSLKRWRGKQGQLPDVPVKGPLHAILVEGEVSGYVNWDFATFDGTNWHSFQNGLITGLTMKVVYSVELPGTEDI